MTGPGFIIEGGLWHGRKLHELYGEAHTPWDWHPRLFERAREVGITLLLLALRSDGGGLPRRAGRAGLQGRLVRDRRHAADRAHGAERQAADHLHRPGLAGGHRRGGRRRARGRRARDRPAPLHQRLSDAGLADAPAHHARPGRGPRDPGRPLRPHHGHGGGRGGRGAGRLRDREALHPGPRRRRGGLGLFAGAGRAGPAGRRLPRRLVGAGLGALRGGRGREGRPRPSPLPLCRRRREERANR